MQVFAIVTGNEIKGRYCWLKFACFVQKVQFIYICAGHWPCSYSREKLQLAFFSLSLVPLPLSMCLADATIFSFV